MRIKVWTQSIFCLLVVFIATSIKSTEASSDSQEWCLFISIEQSADMEKQAHSPEADDVKRVLIERGGYLPERFVDLKKPTKERLISELERLSRVILPSHRMLLYFRGHVHSPEGSVNFYFLPQGATAGNLASYVRDKELNSSLRRIKASEKIVIVDGYTIDAVKAMYANYEQLGTSALISVQPVGGGNFSQAFLDTLRLDDVDVDTNRQLTLNEMFQYLYEDFETKGVLGMTGNHDVVVLKLPSILRIVTKPAGASVSINGENVGKSPYQRVDGLRIGKYIISVRNDGYHTSDEQSISLTSLRGEGAAVSFTLQPLRVYGTVADMSGNAVVPTVVRIMATDYTQETGAKGDYAFDGVELSTGKSYVLKAASSDLYYGSNTFVYEGHTNIECNIRMQKRPWFEVAQMRYDAGNPTTAAEAFVQGLNESTDLPLSWSNALNQFFFDYAKQLVEYEPQNKNYLIATAKLAERLSLKSDAKRYWRQVRRQSNPGSSERQEAEARLKALNPFRKSLLFLCSIIIGLLILSAGYQFHRRRKK